MIVGLLPLLVSFQGSPDLNAILEDPRLSGSVVAAYVENLGGEVLYERNAELRVVPASNQKVPTAAFALAKLGPDYRPKTLIWIQPTRTVLFSPGDPSMTFERLKEAARGIDRRRPLELIQAYPRQIPSDWEHDDLPNRYAAQVSALSFDQGAFALWSVGGQPVLLPDAFGVQVDWTDKTGPVRVQYDPFARRVRVTGEMPKARTRLDTLALPTPDLDAASLFSNKVTMGTAIPTDPPSRVSLGDPISKQIADCLQPSDNLRAENLLLMAGGNSYAKAAPSMLAFLEKEVGVPIGSFRPRDGSGLSRHNLVTAKGMVALLRWADRQPTRALWRSAMAGPGRAGTLRNRLSGVAFAGKTGSLDTVSALSGYVDVSNGKGAIVSVILNHFLCTAAEAREIQDRFVRKVVELLMQP
jgi:D-alanyl-D-alanine carboxypeptidase/D-alanyl-D-alanine-endopeptidase (penicillin-binding protein 4)